MSQAMFIGLALLWAVDTPASGLSTQDLNCAQASSKSAQVELSNAGLIDQNQVDNSRTEIEVLNTQTLAPDHARQVFRLVWHQPGKPPLTAIIVTETADGECPYAPVKTYVVSHQY